MEIKIYTDGACVGNPGPGGWAAIILLENKKDQLFGGEKLTGQRKNKLSIDSWRKIYNNVKKRCSQIHPDLPEVIEKNLDEIEKNWPKNIPSGIIHADLFPDNIFFEKDKLSGIIDYYFSCNDFYAFEIAICLNALCFEGKNENLSFNVTKAKKFIDGYSSLR